MKYILLLVISSLIGEVTPIDSIAATWVKVGRSDSMVAEIERDSLRRSGAKVKVWVKWLYDEPTEINGVFPKKTFQSLKSFAIYDCTNQTNLNLQEIFYSERDGGQVVQTTSVLESPSGYDVVVPDSMGEAILKFVCKETTRKK